MAASFRIALFSVVFLACGAFQATASTLMDVPDSGDLFRFHLLDPGEKESYLDDDDPDAGKASAFRLSEKEIASMRVGADYWRLLLEAGAANTSPLHIEISTVDAYDDNASALSYTTARGPREGATELAAALAGDWFGETGKERNDPLAAITIDHGRNAEGEWYVGPMASLPHNGDLSDLSSTLLHELGHALGMGADVYGDLDENTPSFFFSPSPSLWSRGLRDMNGKPAQAGMIITSDPDTAPGAFVTDGLRNYSGVYFTGTHVQDVLNGALIAFASDPGGARTGGDTPAPVPGLPVNGWEFISETTRIPEFSHIELQNSLMSHQDYRNWNTFMEAELAAMQDVGLVIDRRNWYGYSIYNSGEKGALRPFVNANPYFARNADGDWLPGEPNATPWGTGLHVYGGWNEVTQAADLLSSGAYGLGVRMDGQGNRLTVAPGVRVHADGPGGTALLVSYGKGHSVILRGEARALGEGGVAARFDFGDNELGNNTEYRGSWIRNIGLYNENTKTWDVYTALSNLLPGEIKGALVDSFDVSGRLAGRDAALYIGPNAWVANVNIMNGADLQGDIISLWNPLLQLENTTGTYDAIQYRNVTGASNTDLTTSLTFGRLAASDGSAADAPDPAFRMRYDGDIRGGESIRMAVQGGRLSFNGRAEVLDVRVDEGAALSGNADYALHTIRDNTTGVGGTFTNAGTVAPGNSLGTITVKGDYHQTATGRLLAEFDASASDRLTVTGNAVVEGSVHLAPLPDYYAGSLAFTPLTASGNLTEAYTTDLLFESPTLNMAAAPLNNGTFRIAASRAADAYSRYAANGNAAEAGRALSSAEGVRGDMRGLYAALDFSAPDGSGVADALTQLSPDAYGNAALASFDMQRMLSDLILPGTFSRAPHRDGEWHAFVQPYAGTFDQPGRGGRSGYEATNAGLIGGAERSTPGGLTVGGHVVFNHQSMNGDANGKLHGEGLYLGAQGRYAPADWDGWNVFGIGRVGMEKWRMKRAVSFNGYDRENTKDWTGVSGTARVGGGHEADYGMIKAGPFAALDYAFSSRPSLTENGGGGSRLHLDAATFHSLRSSLGVRLSTDESPLGEHAVWKGHAFAAWNHELLDKAGTMHASFVEAARAGFSNTVKVPGRDSLGLGAGVSFNTDKDVTFSLNAGSEMFRRDGNAVYGNLAVEWTF